MDSCVRFWRCQVGAGYKPVYPNIALVELYRKVIWDDTAGQFQDAAGYATRA
jgi:hypothetical protein